jgi:hypothetical protein
MIPWLLDHPEVGWVAVLAYLAWEIRGPKGKIKDLSKSLGSIIVVVRAIARANNSIDANEVDNYLVDENGSEPGDFINFEGNGDGKEEKISVEEGD